MIQLEFGMEDMQALQEQRFDHPHPWVRRKLEAVYLKSQNLSHEWICQMCGIGGNTLRRYLREYEAGGLERLKELHFYRPQSELEEHRPAVQTELALHPVASLKEAGARITALTGFKRGLTQVRHWLKKLGFQRRKVGMVPAKANPPEQAAFKEQKLEPRLREAQAGQRAVYFVDAAHFVLGPFLGYLWSLQRVFIRAPSGRQRFNVLGALNAVTHQLITVTNDTYITATSVGQLLHQLAAATVGMPVTVIMDNARYQRCAAVMSSAQALGIELLFLPTYSPNLNLIERLWKWVKKECLSSQYYANFAEFKGAIVQCLNTTQTEHREELQTLLTLNFQTFEKAPSMAA